MQIKTGKGSKSNSSTWKVCYDEKSEKYTALTTLATQAGHWFRLYEIDKSIFDKVGTYEDDDYLSERLIKDNGRLLYENSADKYCGYPNIQVNDTVYRTLCSWAFKDDKDKILGYDETDEDKSLIDLATTMFKAYNGSYKPNLVPRNKITNECGYYSIKHIGGKYIDVSEFALIYTDIEKGNFQQRVCMVSERIDELLPKMFLLLSESHIEWEDICKSEAVLKALRDKYGSDNLKVMFYQFHPAFGETLVCSECIDEQWKDGYYDFFRIKEKDGSPKKLCQFR